MEQFFVLLVVQQTFTKEKFLKGFHFLILSVDQITSTVFLKYLKILNQADQSLKQEKASTHFLKIFPQIK